ERTMSRVLPRLRLGVGGLLLHGGVTPPPSALRAGADKKASPGLSQTPGAGVRPPSPPLPPKPWQARAAPLFLPPPPFRGRGAGGLGADRTASPGARPENSGARRSALRLLVNVRRVDGGIQGRQVHRRAAPDGRLGAVLGRVAVQVAGRQVTAPRAAPVEP